MKTVRPPWHRKNERKSRPARRQVQLDRPVHELAELPRDREPETAPGGLRALEAVEAIEDLSRVLVRNTGPLVLDRQQRFAVAPIDLDSHGGSGRRVHEGVLEENPADLEGTLLVAESVHLTAVLD